MAAVNRGPKRPADFDRLAWVYRPLEVLAFGGALERARFHFLDRLRDCRSILLLGEGDGRCLERLLRIAPDAHFHCVDASRAMLKRAAARISSAESARVTFEQADVRTASFPRDRYDAVLTYFFLDCFTPDEVADVIVRVQPALRGGATWLFADFSVPPGRAARWRARAWLGVLYAFFRWQTGLAARSLPPSEALLRAQGFHCTDEQDFDGGLIRSAVYQGPASNGAR
jgi:ubiquinone/menaquinone biosynthesis C-methylase UbiE